ncbi:MAG: TM2 domain-containing protein [Alphaproteobacteria bacterium]|nr:TM2 domain-containing protein [Alphaproteobacteria bacterium]
MAMVYCRECGHKHSDRAKACPKCGYCAIPNGKSIAVYLVLVWLLGIWGGHKFYAGKTTQAVIMLLMGTIGWLLIVPGVAVCVWAFVDFIIALCNINTPEKIFDSK